MRKSLLFAFCLLMISCAVYASAESTTVMVYMCGSNLETLYSAATTDVQEIQNSGLDSSQTQVYFMAGGSKNWNHNTIGGDQGGVYTLAKKTHGDGVNLKTLEKGLSDMNMGEQSTLAWFLNYCREHSQTDRYALILWDHGGGPVTGVCWDEQYSGDHLTLDELTGALAASPFAEKKLSWIGFDACLMSSVEVASKMAPYAEYMIASQAEEPGSGWNYAFLNGLENDRDGGDTGKRVIESYFSVSYNASPDLTMACIDLSKIGAIEESMDTMYQGMTAQLNLDTFSSIAKLRQTATGFGKSVEYQRSSSGYDLVDVVSLSACYADKNPEGAESVRQAVADAVVYSRSNISDCNGLSVYHPFRNQKRFLTEWSEAYKKLDFCPGYTSYVDAYGKIMSGEHLVRWNDLTNIQAVDLSAEQNKENIMISLNITEEQAANFASARLVVLSRNPYDSVDSAFFRLYSTTDVEFNGTTLTAAYDGMVMMLVNDTASGIISRAVSYRVTENGLYQLSLYPYGEDYVRPEKPIIAEYAMDASGQLMLKGYLAYDEMTDAYSARAEVDLSKYIGVTFQNEYRVPTRNTMDEYAAFDSWDSDTHTSMQWKARRDVTTIFFKPTLAVDSDATEDRWVAFEITDTQGNVYMTEMAPISGSKLYPLDYTVSGAMPALLSADAAYYTEDDSYLILLNIANLSSEEQIFYLSELTVNGISLEPEYFMILDGQGRMISIGKGIGDYALVTPGEVGSVGVLLGEADLESVLSGYTADHVAGKIVACSAETGDMICWFDFSYDPSSGPIEVYREAGGAIYMTLDMPVAYPLQEDKDLILLSNMTVMVESGVSPENSKILTNLTIQNTADHDCRYFLDHVKINGTPIEKKYYGLDRLGGRIIAPGEEALLNIDIRYADVSDILPATSILSIEFMLNAVHDGDNTIMVKIPIIYETEIPLSCFYGETTVLPEQALVDLGREYDALNADSAKLLFAHEDCDIYLEGLYVIGYKPVMLLRVVNASTSEWTIALGQAELDGRKATIGRSIAPYISTRNRRNAVYGINKEAWPEMPGVRLDLKTGETQYCYAELSPSGEEPAELSSIAFRVFMDEANGSFRRVYSDEIQISFDEPAPLSEETNSTLPAKEVHVKQGRALPLEDDPQVLIQTVSVPESSLIREISLHTALPEDEQISGCYYFLRRLVHSDAELADMNILNKIVEDRRASLSFADGNAWMIYEAMGSMQIEQDGRIASAVYPGLRPMITNGEESIAMMVRAIRINADGSAVIESPGNYSVYLASTRFQGLYSGGYLGDIKIVLEQDRSQAEIFDFDFYSCGFPSLTDLVSQRVILHPAEHSLDRLSQIMMDDTLWEEHRLYQYLFLNEPQIRLALEPLTDPENYDVLFLYATTDGAIKCFEARPLIDFIQ